MIFNINFIFIKTFDPGAVLSWIQKQVFIFLHFFAVKVLKTGKIPKHVAIIMDGNRRYGKKMFPNQIMRGHTKGISKLTETLDWCMELGINELTVFAFSIENFRRTKEEVEGILELMRQKFKSFLDDREKLIECGIKIRILGNLTMIPTDLCNLIGEVMEMTENNNKTCLNIALSYTSRDEITRSMKIILKGIQDEELQVQEIDEDLISQCLDTSGNSNPEVLIRTSGEVRLSDFLLWQTSSTYVHFANSLWPEFSFWNLLSAIFNYQRCYKKLLDVKNKSNNVKYLKSVYAQKVHSQRMQELLKLRNVSA